MDQAMMDYINQQMASLQAQIDDKGQDRLILVQEEPRGPSQLIEVPITRSGLQTVPFPDIQQLRSTTTRKIIIKGIRLIPPGALTNAPTSGLVTAPVTELVKMTLLVYCEGWEKAQLLPVIILTDIEVPGGTEPHRFKSTRFNNWEDVDWSKTKIQFSNGTVSAAGAAGYAVLFDVEYIVLNSKNQEIIGPG